MISNLMPMPTGNKNRILIIGGFILFGLFLFVRSAYASILLDGTGNTGGSQADPYNYSCPGNPNNGMECQANAYQGINFLGSQPDYFPQDSAYTHSTGKLSKITVRAGLVGMDTTGTMKMQVIAEEIANPNHAIYPESDSINISALASSDHGTAYTEITFTFASTDTVDFVNYSILAIGIIRTGHITGYNDLVYDFAINAANTPTYWLGYNSYYNHHTVPYLKIEDDAGGGGGGDSGSTPEPAISMSADPASIASGGSATISWTSINATSCTVNDNNGTSGSFSTGSLTETTAYSGTCTGPDGSASGTVTVTVGDSSPPGSEPSGPRPVVIIPGIMGSELYDGPDLVWPNVDRLANTLIAGQHFLSEGLNLDNQGNSIRDIRVGDIVKEVDILNRPATKTFSELISFLQDKGYNLNQNLFVFPYDWRLDLDNTKLFLKNKIQHIKDQTGFNKVDIIAHSMGGLLTEDYIKQYGTDSINKLVFVGTPHLGAPKAANALITGDLGFEFGFINLVNTDQIKQIAHNSPAIYELLPSQTYFDAFDGYIRPWPTASEVANYSDTSDFLSSLSLNSDLLHEAENFSNNELTDINYGDIQVSNIVGCKMPTQNVYYVKSDGHIVQIRYGNGDETVPFVSADDSPGAEYYVIGGKHVNLPSTAGVRELISSILTDTPQALPGNISQSAISSCGLTGKELNWRSPVSVQIHDSLGNHSGPLDDGTIENNIPGAAYDMVDGEAYIFLPTDEGQIYTIQGTGTATGTFDLIISDINNDQITNNTLFNDVSIIPGSSISFTVSQTSDDSYINLDFDNSGNIVDLPASNQFADQNQALMRAMSVPAPPPAGGGGSGGGGGSSGGVAVLPQTQNPISDSNQELNNGKILGKMTVKLADGTLALDTGDGRTVYMIGDNGKKYGFTLEEAFRGLGFKFDPVVPADLSGYELGGLIFDPNEIHPNGSLVFDGQTVWFINYEKRFGFYSLEQFELDGFDPKQIVPANKNDMFLAETNLLNN